MKLLAFTVSLKENVRVLSLRSTSNPVMLGGLVSGTYIPTDTASPFGRPPMQRLFLSQTALSSNRKNVLFSSNAILGLALMALRSVAPNITRTVWLCSSVTTVLLEVKR